MRYFRTLVLVVSGYVTRMAALFFGEKEEEGEPNLDVVCTVQYVLAMPEQKVPK